MRLSTTSHLLTTFLALALILTLGFGFRECNAPKDSAPVDPQKVAEQRVQSVATGLDYTEDGLTAGIAVAKSLRLRGKATREGNLRKARIAQKVNDAIVEAIDFANANDSLDGAGVRKLHEQIASILDSAKHLEEKGDIQPGGDAEIFFDLGVTLGRNQLVSVFDDLGDAVPDGLNIPITPKAKAKFKSARKKAVSNADVLAAAIAELEGPHASLLRDERVPASGALVIDGRTRASDIDKYAVPAVNVVSAGGSPRH
jgi:hypothetical protein